MAGRRRGVAPEDVDHRPAWRAPGRGRSSPRNGVPVAETPPDAQPTRKRRAMSAADPLRRTELARLRAPPRCRRCQLPAQHPSSARPMGPMGPLSRSATGLQRSELLRVALARYRGDDATYHVPRHRGHALVTIVLHQTRVPKIHNGVRKSSEDQVALRWFESRLNKALYAIRYPNTVPVLLGNVKMSA